MSGCCRCLRSDFWDGEGELDRELIAIALNYILPKCTPQIWVRAKWRLCADGGVNRLQDQFPHALYPHTIVGDFDSARREVLDELQMAGSELINLSEDQNSTDLQKCLNYILGEKVAEKKPIVVALGAIGGRLDHTLSNLSTLGRYRDVDLVLIGEGNTARLLRAGDKSIIHIQPSSEGPMCGLIPLAGPATVTTKGLKYNLNNETMSFGGLISTSNSFASEQVKPSKRKTSPLRKIHAGQYPQAFP